MMKYFERLQTYAALMRLNRPIGIFLLLWPTLWALWIASDGKPDLKILMIFILGVVIMRSAGCIINDIADRNFDGAVARTKDRPLATKKNSINEALLLFILLALCGFSLVLFLNHFTILLAILGMIIVIVYPFMKRFTYFPQVILGLAFAWGVPMAFAAQSNSLPAISWLLFIIAFLWIVVYDTQYAMADRADDMHIGVRSTAILFANADRVIIGMLQIIILILLYLLEKILFLNYWFALAIISVASLFIYQQYLIKDRNPQQCFRAFLNNHWVGMVIFLAIACNYPFGH